MRQFARIARGMVRSIPIPLFAKEPAHPSVPLERKSAGARNEGQGRPTAGACALPLTVASTLAGWRRGGDRAHVRRRPILIVVSMLACASPVVVLAQPEPGQRRTTAEPHAAHIAEASQRFGIPERWIRAIMQAESNGDPRAISPKGAMGLMQVMPATWDELRVRHRLGNDIYDIRDNIVAGAGYIRELFDRYGSPGWIAAYNADPARYEASLAGRPLPAETRACVAAVTTNLGSDPNLDVVMIATNNPRAWTRAPLFVVHQGRKSAATAPAERSSKGAATVPTVRNVSAIAPQPGDLFVTRVAEETVR